MTDEIPDPPDGCNVNLWRLAWTINASYDTRAHETGYESGNAGDGCERLERCDKDWQRTMIAVSADLLDSEWFETYTREVILETMRGIRDELTGVPIPEEAKETVMEYLDVWMRDG